MSVPKPTTKANRVVCKGCGGRGGGHRDLKCPFWLNRVRAGMSHDQAIAAWRKDRARKGAK